MIAMAQNKPNSRLVYTTDPEPAAPAPRPTAPDGPPSAGKQTARIWRDSKRRRGKTVTVVGGLRHDPDTLEGLLKKLKQHCGAGGTVKDGEIEVQGDHREKIAALLAGMGYGVKHVGG
jgi:translation initiation factor 1